MLHPKNKIAIQLLASSIEKLRHSSKLPSLHPSQSHTITFCDTKTSFSYLCICISLLLVLHNEPPKLSVFFSTFLYQSFSNSSQRHTLQITCSLQPVKLILSSNHLLSWDDWVPHDRLRKLNEENKQLAQSLKSEMDDQNSRVATKSSTKKKKTAGSDVGSARGSEDRQSVPPTSRGQKRGRDYDLEKVGQPVSSQALLSNAPSTPGVGEPGPPAKVESTRRSKRERKPTEKAMSAPVTEGPPKKKVRTASKGTTAASPVVPHPDSPCSSQNDEHPPVVQKTITSEVTPGQTQPTSSSPAQITDSSLSSLPSETSLLPSEEPSPEVEVKPVRKKPRQTKDLPVKSQGETGEPLNVEAGNEIDEAFWEKERALLAAGGPQNPWFPQQTVPGEPYIGGYSDLRNTSHGFDWSNSRLGAEVNDPGFARFSQTIELSDEEDPATKPQKTTSQTPVKRPFFQKRPFASLREPFSPTPPPESASVVRKANKSTAAKDKNAPQSKGKDVKAEPRQSGRNKRKAEAYISAPNSKKLRYTPEELRALDEGELDAVADAMRIEKDQIIGRGSHKHMDEREQPAGKRHKEWNRTSARDAGNTAKLEFFEGLINNERLIIAGHSLEGAPKDLEKAFHRNTRKYQYKRAKKNVANKNDKQEETFQTRPAVKIDVPDLIKSLLVDDWENVTKNMALLPVPAKHPVSEVLLAYFDDVKGDRRLGSADADLLEEVVQGLKEYFEKCLGKILLYRFEREQYFQVRQGMDKGDPEYKDKSIADIYGVEHLCRLFGKLLFSSAK